MTTRVVIAAHPGHQPVDLLVSTCARSPTSALSTKKVPPQSSPSTKPAAPAPTVMHRGDGCTWDVHRPACDLEHVGPPQLPAFRTAH